jgi:hypothetical protein
VKVYGNKSISKRNKVVIYVNELDAIGCKNQNGYFKAGHFVEQGYIQMLFK